MYLSEKDFSEGLPADLQEQLLREIGSELLIIITRNLLAAEKKPTNAKQSKKKSNLVRSNLVKTANFKVSGGELSVFMNDYAKYIDSGRKPGTAPPLEALKEWVNRYQIGGNTQQSKEDKELGFAFAINAKRKKQKRKPLPISVILKWIRDNNIQPKGESKNSLAYRIQRWIKLYGIAPRPYLEASYTSADKFINPKIDEFIGSAISAAFDQIK